MPIGFSGEPLEIGFNPNWLRDGIESVVEDELTLRLINPLRPAVIAESGAGDGGGDFWYLIMPIRLAG
jgi:DNA polymerase-3 subunit beta